MIVFFIFIIIWKFYLLRFFGYLYRKVVYCLCVLCLVIMVFNYFELVEEERRINKFFLLRIYFSRIIRFWYLVMFFRFLFMCSLWLLVWYLYSLDFVNFDKSWGVICVVVVFWFWFFFVVFLFLLIIKGSFFCYVEGYIK